MPKEMRKLIFDAREIEAAIGLYLDTSKAVAKSKHIVSIALQSGGEVGALAAPQNVRKRSTQLR